MMIKFALSVEGVLTLFCVGVVEAREYTMQDGTNIVTIIVSGACGAAVKWRIP